MKDGPLALGLHKRDSFHDIVTAKECKIVNKDYNENFDLCIRTFCRKKCKILS